MTVTMEILPSMSARSALRVGGHLPFKNSTGLRWSLGYFLQITLQFLGQFPRQRPILVQQFTLVLGQLRVLNMDAIGGGVRKTPMRRLYRTRRPSDNTFQSGRSSTVSVLRVSVCCIECKSCSAGDGSCAMLAVEKSKGV